MNSDLNTEENKTIAIVGGGTMGLFIAQELVLNGLNVIIVESGDEKIRAFENDSFENIGHLNNGISIGRTQGYGGTSNLWGGQLAEFVSDDIDTSKNFNQPAWPITWSELRKYYAHVYEKLGFSNPVNDYSETLITSSREKYQLESFYTYWLKYPNFKKLFFKTLMESEQVSMYENTIVTDLVFEKNKVVALKTYNEGEFKFIKNFNTVILANGTIEICRLLLMVAENGDTPISRNKWIGKCFQDHLNLSVGSVENASKEFFNKFSNVIKQRNKLQPKIRLNFLKDKFEYIGVSGYFFFKSDVSHHLDNFKQFAKSVLGRSDSDSSFKERIVLFFKTVRSLPIILPLIWKYLINNRIYVPFDSSISLNIQSQQITLTDSEITLSKHEFDSIGRPKVLLNWKIDGCEIKAIKDFCSLLNEYLKINKLGKLKLHDWLCSNLDNKTLTWKKHVSDIYHQAGGTIMSNSFDEGVVDKNLKIHNTDNVFICGASVMPTSSYANTGLTSLALAARLAEHLNTKR
jgi:choline dehydrogenase-like flavoprotein